MDASRIAEGDPELADLAARIAETRLAIAESKADRERIERSVAESPKTDPANDALRKEIAAARKVLEELRGIQAKRPNSLEATLRNGLIFAGVSLALPSGLAFAALVWSSFAHPEERPEAMIYLVLATPLVLGLALVARGRFAKFRTDKQDLDGEFL